MLHERAESEPEGPIIRLPEDPDGEWTSLLQEKLEQYKEWAGAEERRYRAPEQRITSRDYANRALSILLEEEELNTHALARRLEEEQGDLFHLESFNHGLAVIDNYTQDLDFLKQRVEAGRETE